MGQSWNCLGEFLGHIWDSFGTVMGQYWVISGQSLAIQFCDIPGTNLGQSEAILNTKLNNLFIFAET